MHSPDGITCENSSTVRDTGGVDMVGNVDNVGDLDDLVILGRVSSILFVFFALRNVVDLVSLIWMFSLAGDDASCVVSVKVLVSESADLSL